ncbi:hypothetical protein J7L67_06515 [bacterium]|nr:hypothetical protein [bacterium]
MKIAELTDEVIAHEIREFKKNISSYVCSLLEHFLPESSVNQFRYELIVNRYDSVIQSILEKIFLFARGEIKLSSDKEKWMINQACDTICTILWKSPAEKDHFNTNWTEWVKTPLGFAIKACYARLKDTLTCEELGILLGYTRQEISRRAKLKLLPNKRVGGSYVFFKKELIKKKILFEQ